jgi:hypothetical protein
MFYPGLKDILRLNPVTSIELLLNIFFIRSKDSRDSFFKIMILASEHDRHYSIIIFLLTRGNFFIGIVPVLG